jgi:ribulose 1,5-bisphosphate carboxylase large subunit-like protein
MAVRQAVDARLGGHSLKEYAEDHVELAKALETWS